jgi:hypothetical protein
MKENGIFYTDVWEEKAVERFVPWMDMELAHCPVLGAQEGFVRATTLHHGMLHLLADSQPLFMPAGELLSEKVKLATV